MKKLITTVLGIALCVSLFAQGGLSQGQAVGKTTANPTTQKKTCPYCGIEMNNITYAWQHESWCPYYQSKGSSGGGSKAVSADRAVAGAAVSAVGSALGNALSDWLNAEPQGDHKRYFSQVPGHTLGYNNDPRLGKRVPEYIVLRDRSKGTLGVWRNAWTFRSDAKASPDYGKMTDYPGQWQIKPKYDFINLRSSGINQHIHYDCVAIVGLKDGKGDNAPLKYGLVEASISWGYGHELVPPKYASFVATNPEQTKSPLMVIFGNPGKDGKMVWGLWKLIPKAKPREFEKMDVRQILPDQFDAVRILESYIVASKGGKYGLYDQEGKLLLPHEYTSIDASWDRVAVQKEPGGPYGLMDVNGSVILPFEYESLSLAKGGTAIYGSNGRFGALLPDGKRISAEYEQIDESFWTRPNGERVVTVFVQKDGERFYPLGDRLIPVRVSDDSRKRKRTPFSEWYDQKTAVLKKAFMERGEFEKEADYQARIGDPATLGKYLSSKIPAPVEAYLNTFPKDTLSRFYVGKYDMDNECFPVNLALFPWDIVRIPVPYEAAPEFKEKYDWTYMREHITLELRNDYPAIKTIGVRLRSIKGYFPGDPTTYSY